VSQTLVALIAALVGACAALGGQALGPVIQSRRAHRQWLRDKRAALYEEFMAVANNAGASLPVFGLGVPLSSLSHEEMLKAQKPYDEHFRTLVAAASRVELYASLPLEEAVSNVWANYQLAYVSLFMEDPPETPGEARQHFKQDVATALQLIRQQLGVD
jgi:hypothetical protein